MTPLPNLIIKNEKAHRYLLSKGYEVRAGRSTFNSVCYINNYCGVEYVVNIHDFAKPSGYVSYPFPISDKETIKRIEIANNRLKGDLEELRKWIVLK